VPDRVEIEFRRAADRLFAPGAAILVAVSGGADSVALLHLLARRAVSRDGALRVAHLDHGLRRGSIADRRFVERLARELGLPCTAERRAVADDRGADESVEEAARRVRREFLTRVARVHGCAAIALGHTLDDQAETVLLRLLRGAGPAALAGMAERGPGPFVRPLLGLGRDDLRALLRRRGVPWREDPSNRDERFDRNRVRRKVLPALAAWGHPAAARALVRAADLLREDAALLDAWAARRLRRWRLPAPAGAVALDAGRLARAEPALGRRVVRLALREVGLAEKRVSARIVGAVLDLASTGTSRSLDLASGVVARRSGAKLELLRPSRP